jgi:Zn-dependent protease
LALYWATDFAMFAAVGTVGAWINLFNLIPFWQLDGNRGFRSLSRTQRWLATAAIGIAFAVTMEECSSYC